MLFEEKIQKVESYSNASDFFQSIGQMSKSMQKFS